MFFSWVIAINDLTQYFANRKCLWNANYVGQIRENQTDFSFVCMVKQCNYECWNWQLGWMWNTELWLKLYKWNSLLGVHTVRKLEHVFGQHLWLCKSDAKIQQRWGLKVRNSLAEENHGMGVSHGLHCPLNEGPAGIILNW